MTEPAIRVAIADDQALVRAGFRMILEAQPDIRVVAAGDQLLAPSVTRRFVERLTREPRPMATGVNLDRLTSREQEVLRFLSRGMSNAEIADALVVSESTVKTHVGHVLAKLGLRDRVQAVVLAYESGLVRAGDPERNRADAPRSA